MLLGVSIGFEVLINFDEKDFRVYNIPGRTKVCIECPVRTEKRRTLEAHRLSNSPGILISLLEHDLVLFYCYPALYND